MSFLHSLLKKLLAPASSDVGVQFAIYLDADAPSRQRAHALVDALVVESQVVVFSSARGAKEPSYWAQLFAHRGYRAYDLVRLTHWWDQRIPWIYRQNLIVYATDAAAHADWTPVEVIDYAQPAVLMPELDRQLEATVCIPWRPSPSRMAAFDRVLAYWDQFGWPVITADSDTEVFSLAQARNAAVAQAQTEVVVVSDADTLIDPLNILRAVAEPTGVCWPFTNYRVISTEYLDLPYEMLETVPTLNTWFGEGVQGVGGCLITTRSEWNRLGGQCGEFIGWGWEDTAFTCVVRTLSTVKRAVGNLYAFEHNTSPAMYVDAKADSPGWDRDVSRNEHLMAPYLVADLVPWKMRNLLKTRRAAEMLANVTVQS